MTTLDQISADAHQVQVGRVLLSVFVALFWAIGWCVGKVVLVVAFVLVAIRTGYRDAKSRKASG